MNVLARVRRLLSKQRDLRMIWEVEREGRKSLLAGASHFFPYHFRDSLRRYIAGADTVLLEGPLDEGAMRKVIEAGAGPDRGSLYDALDARTIQKIKQAFARPPPLSASQLYWDVLQGAPADWLKAEIEGLKPWMAFLQLWAHYRRRDGWTCSIELDAASLAAGMGKEVHTLETIEEQIEALNRIPLERIVGFLKNVDWETYRDDFVRHYLAGNLPELVATARAFPTFCEPIIERRDPILHQRMKPFFERGNAIALVGVTHCPGILGLLRAQGYAVRPAGRNSGVPAIR